MHLAPERGIFQYLSAIPGLDYEAFDLQPKNFPFAPVKPINLVTDLPSRPSHYYDVIIHSHVMEHIPCNITAVLFHLNRMLKNSGEQACVIPFLPGNYAEDLGPMERSKRIERFGQGDHLRRFGSQDVATSLGMIFRLPETYDLDTVFDPLELDRFNIPGYCRKGFTPHTFLRLKRSDMLLTAE